MKIFADIMTKYGENRSSGRNNLPQKGVRIAEKWNKLAEKTISRV